MDNERYRAQMAVNINRLRLLLIFKHQEPLESLHGR
jgi:hypothetical protein